MPAAIGIEIRDPEVMSTEEFDGASEPTVASSCVAGRASPRCTRTIRSGVLHTEAQSARREHARRVLRRMGSAPDRLVRRDRSAATTRSVAFHVDGRPYTQDPRAIRADRPEGDRDRDRAPAGGDPEHGRISRASDPTGADRPTSRAGLTVAVALRRRRRYEQRARRPGTPRGALQGPRAPRSMPSGRWAARRSAARSSSARSPTAASRAASSPRHLRRPPR